MLHGFSPGGIGSRGFSCHTRSLMGWGMLGFSPPSSTDAVPQAQGGWTGSPSREHLPGMSEHHRAPGGSATAAAPPAKLGHVFNRKAQTSREGNSVCPDFGGRAPKARLLIHRGKGIGRELSGGFQVLREEQESTGDTTGRSKRPRIANRANLPTFCGFSHPTFLNRCNTEAAPPSSQNPR